MKTHNLKCWPEYFEAILCGEKNFEVRYNDRDYKKGDILVLQEYDAMRDNHYTGREVVMRVKYIWHDFGMLPDWVVMAIIPTGNAKL